MAALRFLRDCSPASIFATSRRLSCISWPLLLISGPTRFLAGHFTSMPQSSPDDGLLAYDDCVAHHTTAPAFIYRPIYVAP